MRHKVSLASLACAALFACAPAFAVDVWDQSTEDDNSAGTDNGLVHGAEQVHDLGAEAGIVDQDWYTLDSLRYSSFEVVVDGTTGDMNLSTGGDVVRLDSLGTTELQDSAPLAGFSRVLRWANNTATTETNYIRVSGAACTTTCSSNDQYRIRMYETTYSIPRFNNSGTQTTVLLVGSTVSFTCSATFHFFAASGALLGSTSNSFSTRELFVLSTSTLGFAAGQSGSVFVAHTCGYGGLAGKAVALEPATGFTFDTPMVPKPI